MRYYWSGDWCGSIYDYLYCSSVDYKCLALLISLAPCAPEVEEETERVALGIREYLDDFARDFNALTWKDLAPDGLGWKDKILQALQDPNVRIYFNLDGLESVWSSIQRVASGYGGATDWELYQIYSNPDIWDTILWFRE